MSRGPRVMSQTRRGCHRITLMTSAHSLAKTSTPLSRRWHKNQFQSLYLESTHRCVFAQIFATKFQWSDAFSEQTITPMAKKAKRTIDVDSDGDYDHFSEESDASFTLTSNKKRSRKNGVAPSKRQRVSKSIDKPKTSQLVNGHTTRSIQDFDGTGIPHAKSTHVIADPVPLQKALLAWYADVHETRGMPWRKPYDATLNREQRAQRAYEVSTRRIIPPHSAN